MTHDEAMVLLSEFLEGSLSAQEHQAIAKLVETDPELRQAFEEEKLLSRLLRTQQWVRARTDFTARVLKQAGLPVAQGEALLDRVLEHLSAYAPAGTVVLVALLYGQTIIMKLWDLWRGVVGWIGGAIGIETLKTNPAFAVASLALVGIGVIIAFELSRRNQSSA